MSADTLAALIILACIFGGALLYYGSKLYFWARGVNSSTGATPDYVAHNRQPSPPATPFLLEREPEREREPAERGAEPAPQPAGKIYTADQIATLTAQAEERAVARALGLLLGRQLLGEGDRAEAMVLLFGPRGRKHQRVRPLVDAAAAEVTPVAEARLIGVNEGKDGYIEA